MLLCGVIHAHDMHRAWRAECNCANPKYFPAQSVTCRCMLLQAERLDCVGYLPHSQGLHLQTLSCKMLPTQVSNI